MLSGIGDRVKSQKKVGQSKYRKLYRFIPIPYSILFKDPYIDGLLMTQGFHDRLYSERWPKLDR